MAQDSTNEVFEIPATSNGTKTLLTAGKYCDRNIQVNVNVPIPDGYIKPAGNKSITTNGTHDVKSYENAVVNVPVPSGYIKPSGSKSITENGTHDVTQYASAVVNVPQKATQFTNLYDPSLVQVCTRGYWDSSSNTLICGSDNYVNCIAIPYHHVAGEAVTLRVRGLSVPVRDRADCVLLNANKERVQHYQLSSTSYFTPSYDEHGDAVITFKSGPQNYAWEYFLFNFQYIGINSKATARSGPIITINEPIGNGGHAG